MARFIIKLEGKYLEWSTVVDAPVTYGMTLEEFKTYYSDSYGRGPQGPAGESLEDRLERVEATGTSCKYKENIDSLIAFNRAGRGETLLTKQQIIDYYVNRKLEGGVPEGAKIEYED